MVSLRSLNALPFGLGCFASEGRSGLALCRWSRQALLQYPSGLRSWRPRKLGASRRGFQGEGRRAFPLTLTNPFSSRVNYSPFLLPALPLARNRLRVASRVLRGPRAASASVSAAQKKSPSRGFSGAALSAAVFVGLRHLGPKGLSSSIEVPYGFGINPCRY